MNATSEITPVPLDPLQSLPPSAQAPRSTLHAPRATLPAPRSTLHALRSTLLPALFWLLTAALFAAATFLTIRWTPVEASMGPVQKIFYLHLPVAINTFVGCLIVCVASIGYLWQRRAWWDDLAAAAAKVAVLFCSVVLLTGMIWAKSAWGQWWTWSPRLTFSLVLWLLYVVYLMIRPSIESPQRRAVICAVYGLVAFLDVPLVYLSVRLMPDMHPKSVSMTGPMAATLGVWLVPVTMLCAGLIVARYRLHRRENARAAAPDDEAAAALSGGAA